MIIRIRAVAAATALTLTLMTLVASDPGIKAQEPPSTKPAEKPTESIPKKKQDPARRVPPYFGQIGLTTEQRSTIYGIQGKRHEKIEALEQQIAAEKAEMLAQCEATLTETQKKLLDNLRRAAAEPSTTKSVGAPKGPK